MSNSLMLRPLRKHMSNLMAHILMEDLSGLMLLPKEIEPIKVVEQEVTDRSVDQEAVTETKETHQ